MRLGWFPKASYTDLSICCHFELPKGRERNFACHPHSPPVGKIQKHSTPPSGVPFLMNLDPWGTDSYSANWQHNSSNALFCEFFHGRREFQSVGIGANCIFGASNRARNLCGKRTVAEEMKCRAEFTKPDERRPAVASTILGGSDFRPLTLTKRIPAHSAMGT